MVILGCHESEIKKQEVTTASDVGEPFIDEDKCYRRRTEEETTTRQILTRERSGSQWRSQRCFLECGEEGRCSGHNVIQSEMEVLSRKVEDRTIVAG